MCKRIGLFLVLFTMVASSVFAFKYNLSICAIFQNEGPYLKEWIEYHKLLGVEHFYLYNNFSEDNFKEILEPYIKKGEVELTEWNFTSSNQVEWTKVQCDAYNHAIKKAKNKSKWLALIDLDEF